MKANSSDEEFVKRYYPNAVAAPSGVDGGLWVIYDPTQGGRIFGSDRRSEYEAWADAKARIEAQPAPQDQPKGGHWTNECSYCGAVSGTPCMNHAGTKPLKNVHLKRLEPQPALGTCADFPNTPHAQGTCENCDMWKPATESELQQQRESMANNYSPGERQAQPIKETCKENFDEMIDGSWEVGVCQLPKKHKGPHDCTVLNSQPVAQGEAIGLPLEAKFMKEVCLNAVTKFELKEAKKRIKDLEDHIADLGAK